MKQDPVNKAVRRPLRYQRKTQMKKIGKKETMLYEVTWFLSKLSLPPWSSRSTFSEEAAGEFENLTSRPSWPVDL